MTEPLEPDGNRDNAGQGEGSNPSDWEERGRAAGYRAPEGAAGGGPVYGAYVERPGGAATASMILGIVGLAMAVFCCGMGIFGVASSVVAWVLGRSELLKIQSGEASPAGEGQARAGMVLGIVGTVINGLIFIGVILYYVFIVVLGIAVGVSGQA